MADNVSQLLLVSGAEGVGKSTFASVFKNSFLRSLPLRSLDDGLSLGGSFCSECRLADSHETELIEVAKDRGYRITIYHLFAGKLVAQERIRFRSLFDKNDLGSKPILRDFEKSAKGLLTVYHLADLVFLIANQHYFRFVAAYEPAKTELNLFAEAVNHLESSVDNLR